MRQHLVVEEAKVLEAAQKRAAGALLRLMGTDFDTNV
jgi:hypothetical protein